MKMIFRFDELNASIAVNQTLLSLINKIDAKMASALAPFLDGDCDPLSELEAVSRVYPQFVKINHADECVVISIPSETMVTLMGETVTFLTIAESVIVAIGTVLKNFMPMFKASAERYNNTIQRFMQKGKLD